MSTLISSSSGHYESMKQVKRKGGMSLNHDGHLPSRSNREDPMMFSVFFFFFFLGYHWSLWDTPFIETRKKQWLAFKHSFFWSLWCERNDWIFKDNTVIYGFGFIKWSLLGKCSHPFKNYSLCSVIYNCIFFLKNGSRVIQGAAFKLTTIWSRGRLKNIYTWSFRNNLSSFSFCFSISWT